MDVGCPEQLNAQMQAMSSRTKSLELTVSLQGLVLQVIGKLLETITGILEIDLPQPIPIVIEGPQGIEKMLSSSVPNLGLPMSVPALPGMAGMLMGFTSVLGKVSAMNLAVPSFPSDLSSSMLGGLQTNNSDLAASQDQLRTQLAEAIEHGDTEAASAIEGQLSLASGKMENATNAIDSAPNFIANTNDISTCTTKSCKMVNAG